MPALQIEIQDLRNWHIISFVVRDLSLILDTVLHNPVRPLTTSPPHHRVRCVTASGASPIQPLIVTRSFSPEIFGMFPIR